MSRREEKSHYVFQKFFFERMIKIGVISTMGLKEIVRKIGEFKKFVKICKNFVKLKLDYKRLLLKQIKGTEKKLE